MLFYNLRSFKHYKALNDIHAGEWSWNRFEEGQNVEAVYELWHLSIWKLLIYYTKIKQSITSSCTIVQYRPVKDHSQMAICQCVISEKLTSIFPKISLPCSLNNWKSILINLHTVIWSYYIENYNQNESEYILSPLCIVMKKTAIHSQLVQ